MAENRVVGDREIPSAQAVRCTVDPDGECVHHGNCRISRRIRRGVYEVVCDDCGAVSEVAMRRLENGDYDEEEEDV